QPAGLGGQILLEAAQFGDVAPDALSTDQTPVPVDVPGVDLQVPRLPVRLQNPGLEVAPRLGALHTQPEVFGCLRQRRGVDHRGEVPADQVAEVPPEDALAGRVDVGEPAVDIDRVHDIRQAGQEVAIVERGVVVHPARLPTCPHL